MINSPEPSLFPWPCGLLCPNWINFPTYEQWDHYWHNVWIFGRVTGSIITLNDAIQLTLMLISYKYWLAWPMNLVFALKFATAFEQLGLTIPAWGPIGYIGCDSKYQTSDSYDVGCLITAIQTQSIFSILSFWSGLLINIFLILFTNNDNFAKRVMQISIPISVVIPHAVLIPWALVENVYSGNFNCFILSKTALWIIEGFWEVMICTGLAAAIGLIIYHLRFWWRTKELLKHSSPSQKIGERLKMPLFFILIFGSTYVVSASLGIRNLVEADNIQTAAAAFLQCVIASWVASFNPANGPMQQCPMDAPGRVFAYGQFYLIGANLVTSPAFYLYYAGLFGFIFKNDKLISLAKIFKISTTKTTNSATANSSSKKNTPSSSNLDNAKDNSV